MLIDSGDYRLWQLNDSSDYNDFTDYDARARGSAWEPGSGLPPGVDGLPVLGRRRGPAGAGRSCLGWLR